MASYKKENTKFAAIMARVTKLHDHLMMANDEVLRHAYLNALIKASQDLTALVSYKRVRPRQSVFTDLWKLQGERTLKAATYNDSADSKVIQRCGYYIREHR